MGIDSLDKEKRALGRAIRRIREDRRISQTDAAKNMGVADQQWWRWEAGERVPRKVSLPKIAAAVGATVDDLVEARRQVLEGETPGPAVARDLAPLFVLGHAGGERVAIGQGSDMRLVPRHPAQSGYRRVGVFEVAGEAMFPRWKPREHAYFVFDLAPPRGDDVVVELADGTAILREYVSRTPDTVILRHYYPAEETETLPLSQVKALHAVVG